MVKGVTLKSGETSGERAEQGFIALNSCFVYKKGYRLELNANDIESTESVQFKDECLRSCLMAMLEPNGFTCRSLMHMPKDDDCVLTAVDGDKAIRTDEQHSRIPVNFYENKCATPPIKGGMIEVRLVGYKGGEGIVQMVQAKGDKPFIFVVVDGLPDSKSFDVLYHENEVQDCFRMTREERNNAKKLTKISADKSGMAVQPWNTIDFDILRDSALNKTIAVVDSRTGEPAVCGRIKIKGDKADWQSAKNASQSSYNFLSIYLSFFIYLILSI
ncbi:unnamed protein product [Anisakis simplex]|uniref:Apple domain-containing protein n=1 Tax=Anisakis simplex TaxID=6269 RepID=A0A0M3K2T5_ANISI|nr:unnamed protein product [Anisakis simplex]